MNIEITFMSGAGNLFSVIDNRELDLNDKDGSVLAPILCNVNDYNAYNTEGLMFLNNGDHGYSFQCDFFNPDGSTGMMCGNGGRAITRFAQLNGIPIKNHLKFQMAGDVYQASLHEDNIQLYLPRPRVLPEKKIVSVDGNDYKCYYSNTGTHHVVINYYNFWEEEFRKFNIDELANGFRHHKDFEPHGVNVNFYMIKDDVIHLRTFEKGVELETGACGTGAIATALTAHLKDNLSFPIKLIPPSDEELIVDIVGEYDKIEKVILEGPAKVIGQEIVHLPDSLLIH